MSEIIKLDQTGLCNLCKEVPHANEKVQCTICKNYYHASCPSLKHEDRAAAKTFVNLFNQVSTKSNFIFLCDSCLTSFELTLVGSDSQRVNALENKIANMESQLGDIKDLLTNKQETQQTVKSQTGNAWIDKENWSKVKAPPSPAVLVISKSSNEAKNKENIEFIEQKIVENNIPLQDTYKNKNGDLCMLLDSKESRDNLNNLVAGNDEISTKSPKEKHQIVSIVGLPKSYSIPEVTKMIINQNSFIKRFATNNSLEDHFKANFIKPLKNNPEKFQVYASVSPTLREGLKLNSNKVTLGLSSCRVYDQHHVRRCNTCQNFGHFSRNCTSLTSVCAKCAGNHSTVECRSTVKKCVNCAKTGNTQMNHYAYDNNCPSYRAEVRKKQNNDLNRPSLTNNQT